MINRYIRTSAVYFKRVISEQGYEKKRPNNQNSTPAGLKYTMPRKKKVT